MKEKRYAIVRVDGACPSNFETPTKFGFGLDERWCVSNEKGVDCKNCRYGDTKEQLVKKIAQVLIRRKHKLYRKIWGGDWCNREREDSYKKCLEAAKEIVEFLGVE